MNKNEQNDTSRNTLLFRPATPTDIPELKELFRNTVLAVNIRDYTAEEVADWAFCGNRPGRWEELFATLHFIVAVNTEDVSSVLPPFVAMDTCIPCSFTKTIKGKALQQLCCNGLSHTLRSKVSVKSPPK